MRKVYSTHPARAPSLQQLSGHPSSHHHFVSSLDLSLEPQTRLLQGKRLPSASNSGARMQAPTSAFAVSCPSSPHTYHTHIYSFILLPDCPQAPYVWMYPSKVISRSSVLFWLQAAISSFVSGQLSLYPCFSLFLSR